MGQKKDISKSARSTTESSISTAEVENIVEKLKLERIKDSTKANYYTVWKLFNEFFIKLDVKPDNWEDRLILFVGHLISCEKKSQTVRSYICAIRAVLRDDGITLNEDKFLLKAITRACKLKNDTVRTRLPIKKNMLKIIVDTTFKYFHEKGQDYLKVLFPCLFITAYFGLFRIGELTHSPHTIKVVDVNIAANKQKLLFILRSSKTHGKYTKPQMVKISSTKSNDYKAPECKDSLCPYQWLRDFLSVRPDYNSEQESFFVFSDRSPIYPQQARYTMKKILKLAGFDHKYYSFHGYRSGRASDLLRMNVRIPVIKELGRWSSNSVYAYLK